MLERAGSRFLRSFRARLHARNRCLGAKAPSYFPGAPSALTATTKRRRTREKPIARGSRAALRNQESGMREYENTRMREYELFGCGLPRCGLCVSVVERPLSVRRD
jgi:hypothetical protein